MFTKAMSAVFACGLVLGGQAAFADPPQWAHGWNSPDYDYARVVDVDPIYTQVRVSEPRQECWNETRYDDGGYARPQVRGTAGSMILGGIIGAALGNQIGRGDGRRAATVAGALIGSAIGHDAGERSQARYGYANSEYREREPYTVQRCNTRYEDSYENRIEGYRVTYEYHGRQYTTRMAQDPGERVRVRVDVTPQVCQD